MSQDQNLQKAYQESKGAVQKMKTFCDENLHSYEVDDLITALDQLLLQICNDGSYVDFVMNPKFATTLASLLSDSSARDIFCALVNALSAWYPILLKTPRSY